MALAFKIKVKLNRKKVSLTFEYLCNLLHINHILSIFSVRTDYLGASSNLQISPEKKIRNKTIKKKRKNPEKTSQ